MSSLLPLKPSPDGDNRDLDPKLVDFDTEDAERIFGVISSTTARRVLGVVYDEPRTASEIAEHIDSSVQNVSYHLDRLRNAGLIEVVETWYSEQGREMDVYAPTNSSLVLYTGAERAEPSLAAALQRALGGVAVVGFISILVHVQWRPVQPVQPMSRTPPPSDPTLWKTITTFGSGPGALVLLLGLLAIAGAFGVWYWQRYRLLRSSGSSS